MDSKVDNGSTANKGTKRKTVRFTPEPKVLNDVEKIGEMSYQERFHRWWQPDEHERSRAKTKSHCRKLRKMGSSNDVFVGAYDQACSVAASGFDLERVHSAQVLTSDEARVLWSMSRTSDFRGLERWAWKEYAVLRTKHAKELKNAVFQEQARQFISENRDQEIIARLAQEKSKNARVFAALLGQADAIAAKQQEVPRRRSSCVGKRLNSSHELYRELVDPISDESDEERTSKPIIIFEI
jgi:hypothetical protein